MKILTLCLIILIFLTFHRLAETQTEVVFNLDNIDYFIYKGSKFTFQGLINELMQERRDKFVSEVAQILLRKRKE